MGKCGALVCLVILAMDAVAGALSIQAQTKKNKVVRKQRHETKSVGCDEIIEESSAILSETFRLGLAATLLLAIAHILANLLGGCLCLCSMEGLETSSSILQLSFACLISSWITAAVGFTVMIIGVLENSRSQGSCRILHHRFLLIGGILCFVHSLFCIAFYVTATISFGNQTTRGHHRRRHQPHP